MRKFKLRRSDSDVEDSYEEVDSTMYHFEDVPTRSLPKKKRLLLKKLSNTNFLEFVNNEITYVWKVAGFSRVPGNDTLYLRYYDASLPKPSDPDSFEYTIPSKFLSWAIPEDSERAGSLSEGDPQASSEGEVESSPRPRAVVVLLPPLLKFRSRLLCYSTNVFSMSYINIVL